MGGYTMPPVARLGDMCTGHDASPPRGNVEGSPNVFVNSLPVHREGDAWDVHGVPPHGSVLADGWHSVYVNGHRMGYIGAPVACGGSVAEGSENVFVGDCE